MSLAHEEAQSLLGAFALHALEPDEVDAVEGHVEVCPRCRGELAGYLKTAPLLSSAGEAPPPEAPAGLWEEVVSSIGREAVPSLPSALRRVTRRSTRRVMAVVSAGAALVVALAITVGLVASQVNSLDSRTSAQLSAQAAAAARSTRHQTFALSTPSGTRWGSVVITPSGAAYLTSSAFPRLASGDTYQLWGLNGDEAISLGLLSADPHVFTFRVEPGIHALLVTAEPAGGVPQPDSAVLARALLS